MSGGLRMGRTSVLGEAPEMVKRVAVAIARRGLGKTFEGENPTEGQVEEEYWKSAGLYNLQALAAMEELMEPTEAMLEAARAGPELDVRSAYRRAIGRAMRR